MRGRSFADVLDDALQAGALPATAQTSAPNSARRFAAPQPVPFLFATRPPPSSRARTAYVGASAPGDPGAPRRASPTLTPAQAQALDGFNALGGRLAADFDARQLRAAYRQLAHVLHPDRHQARSAADRARLSRDFAAATDHYKALLALFARP